MSPRKKSNNNGVPIKKVSPTTETEQVTSDVKADIEVKLTIMDTPKDETPKKILKNHGVVILILSDMEAVVATKESGNHTIRNRNYAIGDEVDF